MSLFDLLFILCFFAALAVLLSAAIAAIGGHRTQALRKLRNLGIGAAVYMALVLAAGIASTRKIYRLGDSQCFDDWCITVVGANRTRPDSIEVALRLSSRAKRVPQGEKGTVVYLIDSQGRRYNPDPNSVTVPFSTLLQPGESITATRRFDLPADASGLSLVHTNEGGFPIGFFIAGENGQYFHGPPLVRLE
jgi:hypothetical protein